MSSESELTDEAQALGKEFYAAIQEHSTGTDRSQQAREFRVGISDLGFCSEKVRRMLGQQQEEDTDMLLAWIGTALGDHAEQAAVQHWPNAIRQAEVTLTLVGESERSYTLTGHPDLILTDEGVLIDVKTDYGLTVVRRTGPNQQQQFQRHCYAKAAWEAGLFGDLPLEQVRVANVWIDRAGIDREVHVQMEPYSEEWVEQAGVWLDDVVYAYLHDEGARKEPPREMCAVVCGFYGVCRAYDTDAEGLIQDPLTLTSVELYREGLDLEKQGRRLKDQAKQHLEGVKGSTGEFTVRWVHVNATVVPEQVRSAYEKLDIRKIPKQKVK